jgi:UDP-N-acetylglucosamine 2-epimerase (non-hydrolysing)
VFFDELGIPRPDFNLQVGSGSHARQTAAVMTGFEDVLLKTRPNIVLVIGDVNSTIACAMAAAKLHIPVAHVEAGLRSFDRTMPEEINRVLTDQISDWLFVTEQSAEANLAREGIDPARVHFVGNVMIDTLMACREHARRLGVPAALGLGNSPYAVLTLHRPHNVDERDVFEQIMQGLEHISRDLVIVFPMHPRTRQTVLASHGAATLLESGRLRLVEPLGYLEFLGLVERSQAACRKKQLFWVSPVSRCDRIPNVRRRSVKARTGSSARRLNASSRRGKASRRRRRWPDAGRNSGMAGRPSASSRFCVATS